MNSMRKWLVDIGKLHHKNGNKEILCNEVDQSSRIKHYQKVYDAINSQINLTIVIGIHIQTPSSIQQSNAFNLHFIFTTAVVFIILAFTIIFFFFFYLWTLDVFWLSIPSTMLYKEKPLRTTLKNVHSLPPPNPSLQQTKKERKIKIKKVYL